MAIYYKVAKDKILGVLIFFYSRNENKYLLGNYGISTFAFYYFSERERERKYSKTREEIRRSAESFGENIAMNPAISVRGVGLAADIQMSMGISEVTHFNG